MSERVWQTEVVCAYCEVRLSRISTVGKPPKELAVLRFPNDGKHGWQFVRDDYRVDPDGRGRWVCPECADALGVGEEKADA